MLHIESDILDYRRLAKDCVQRGALQKVAEFAPLLRMVNQHRPRVILEIGTAKGGTLYGWCRIAHPEATIVCVDMPGGPMGGGYTERDFPRLRSYARPGQELHLVLGDSHATATREQVIACLDGRHLDLLFIDGDHTYAGVSKDFHDYRRLVGAGGLIALHDILFHPHVPSCNVQRLWAEIESEYAETWRFTQADHDLGWGQWGGVGVIRA